MSKQRNALKSGIFILLTICASIAIIVGIKGLRDLSEPKTERAVSFTLTSDIGGLNVGDDLRVGGYKVGAVQSITVVGASETDAGETPRIRITFTLPKKYVIRHDAVLRIQTGLTGSSCLNFENLGQGAAIPQAEEITGRPGTFQEVLATVQQAAPTIHNILNNIDRKTIPAANDTLAKFGKTADSFTGTGDHATDLIKDIHGQLGPMVQKYHVLVDRATEMMVKIRDLFGDTTPDIRVTMSNVAAATSTLKEKLPVIVERVDKIMVKIDTSVESANAALQDVKTIAVNARELSVSAKGVLVGNKGKLDGMIASLKAASDNLKNATAEIRRSPWRLLYKPAPGEMANLNLYDAAREFADGANELNDASLALRDALQNKDVDKETVQKLMDKVQKSFTNFNDVEQKLWSKVKE